MTDLIDLLGGATKVANDLQIERTRVANWRDRGVPWRFRTKVAKLAEQRDIKLPPDFLEEPA